MFPITTPPIQLIDYQPYSVSSEADCVNRTFSESICHLYSTVSQETIESRFNRLTLAWKNDSMFISSLGQLLNNRSYLEIISMGEKALPLIFASMIEEPDHWFVALNIITGINPVKPENRGNVLAMTDDWLNWAQIKGYVTS